MQPNNHETKAYPSMQSKENLNDHAKGGPEKPVRKPGFLEGKIWIADDFDAPLPEDLLDAFEGKS